MARPSSPLRIQSTLFRHSGSSVAKGTATTATSSALSPRSEPAALRRPGQNKQGSQPRVGRRGDGSHRSRDCGERLRRPFILFACGRRIGLQRRGQCGGKLCGCLFLRGPPRCGLLLGGQLRGGLFCGILCLNLADRLDQILFAPRGDIQKANAGQIPAVGPLGRAAEAEGKPANLESNFDAHLCPGRKPLPGADTAAAKAQIDDAAGESRTVLHQQETGVFVHGKARDGPEILLPGRKLFRLFCRFHRLRRVHSVNIRLLQPFPTGVEEQAAQLHGPSNGHTDTNRWWSPAIRCTD